MLSLIVIFGMVILALRILWDGRIPVSATRIAIGLPVKIFGASLLIAGPIAYAIVVLLTIAGQQGIISFRAPDDVLGAFWCALLGLPAIAAVPAIFLAKPAQQVGPLKDD